MKRTRAIALLGSLALVSGAAACSFDFESFTYAGGEPPVVDAAVDDAGDMQDTGSIVPVDAGPPRDSGNVVRVDSGGGRCPAPTSCFATANTCKTTCNTNYSNCTRSCGLLDFNCPTNCANAYTTCKASCVSTCNSCATSAGCPSEGACADAGN